MALPDMPLLREMVDLDVKKPKVNLKPKSDEEIEYNKPGGFNVMILNNPVTPAEVVVEALMQVLGLSKQAAMKRMLRAHRGGWSCVATYASADVAETKATRIEQAAATNSNYDHYRPYVKHKGPWPLDTEVMEADGSK